MSSFHGVKIPLYIECPHFSFVVFHCIERSRYWNRECSLYVYRDVIISSRLKQSGFTLFSFRRKGRGGRGGGFRFCCNYCMMCPLVCDAMRIVKYQAKLRG